MIKKICTVLCMSSTLAFGAWKQETIEGLKVNLYYPKNLLKSDGNTNALMVNLHGCSQKADDLKNDGNWETVADDYNMIVALPFVPNGGKYSGCWDYYGADHTRSNRDNVYLIKMVQNLLKRSDLKLDENQVYVSGLSSGGGESLVLGCLAPDLFAGIGLNAGPTIGTSAFEIGSAPTKFDTYLKNCKDLATTNKVDQYLKTQLTSIIYGNNDFVVNTKHDLTNADLMSNIYGANTKTSFDTKKLEGSYTDGTGTLYSDAIGPRISLIMNTNLGHNWPAGQGGNGGNFVNKKSINYPRYITKFFFENNRRAKHINKEVLNITSEYNDFGKFVITGKLDKNISNIKSVILRMKNLESGSISEVNELKIDQYNSFQFADKYEESGPFLAYISVLLNNGESLDFHKPLWIGKARGNNPPQIVKSNFEVDENCININGVVVPNDEANISQFQVLIDNQLVGEASINNTTYQFSYCGLEKGEHQLKYFAINEKNLMSNQIEIGFTIGIKQVKASLIEHMLAQRLKWENYGQWHEKYQDNPFTLFLLENGTWSDQKE